VATPGRGLRAQFTVNDPRIIPGHFLDPKIARLCPYSSLIFSILEMAKGSDSSDKYWQKAQNEEGFLFQIQREK
jgi:hypothetical protein